MKRDGDALLLLLYYNFNSKDFLKPQERDHHRQPVVQKWRKYLSS